MLPTTKLVIKDFDPDKNHRTLKDNHTLFGSTYIVDDFYQWLLAHTDHETSWTEDEIGAITFAELDEVRRQLREALVEFFIPLVTKPLSESGDGTSPTASPAGSEPSTTPSDSTASPKM